MKTICFCGIDGCGKTTQAKMLFKNVQKNNKEVIYIHVLSRKSTVFSRLHETSVINEGIKFIRNLRESFFWSTFKIALRLFNVLFDSWITIILNKVKYRKKTIIYDRYFYDILVILAFSYPKISNFIIGFAKFIPRTNVIILFKVDAGIATVRKCEHTLMQAQLYCDLYKKLSKKIKPTLIVNAQLDIKEIEKQIENISLEKRIL